MTNKKAAALLSRFKLITASARAVNVHDDNIIAFDNALELAIKALTDEQNTGYWTKQKTDKTHYIYICSICGGKTRFTKSLYCKDCGSRMVEEG